MKGCSNPPVCPWTSEIPVDDDDRDKNTDGVHDECEEQILGYQRQHQ